LLAEPIPRIQKAVTFSEEPLEETIPLVSHIFARESAEVYLRDALR
jgi:hypothetical protein